MPSCANPDSFRLTLMILVTRTSIGQKTLNASILPKVEMNLIVYDCMLHHSTISIRPSPPEPFPTTMFVRQHSLRLLEPVLLFHSRLHLVFLINPVSQWNDMPQHTGPFDVRPWSIGLQTAPKTQGSYDSIQHQAPQIEAAAVTCGLATPQPQQPHTWPTRSDGSSWASQTRSFRYELHLTCS